MPIPKAWKETFQYYFDLYADEPISELWNEFLVGYVNVFRLRYATYLWFENTFPNATPFWNMVGHNFFIVLYGYHLVIPYLCFWYVLYFYRKHIFIFLWTSLAYYKRWRNVVYGKRNRFTWRHKILFKGNHYFLIRYYFLQRYFQKKKK